MKRQAKDILRAVYPAYRSVERAAGRLFACVIDPPKALEGPLDLAALRDMGLRYVSSLRRTHGGRFVGYLHSTSAGRPVLYGTVSALLLKHLYAQTDPGTTEEIEWVLDFQRDDGLFFDPVIDCPIAETDDWWGWRHLTLHTLMTLALYNVPARKKLRWLDHFGDVRSFEHYLASRDWGKGITGTSNELQNIGVMLQYARDYQGSRTSSEYLNKLYEVLDGQQDPGTGLFGPKPSTPQELSLAVQTAYHFWLLYFYDRRPVRYVDRVIDRLLETQNLLGGYGTCWNSNACEDIDSIDGLLRFGRLTEYRRADIEVSLRRAFPAILGNLNSDGGWVFRRHEALQMVHPQMFSAANESNLFYTWFRTLGLAYVLLAFPESPPGWDYPWNLGRAPGCQFL